MSQMTLLVLCTLFSTALSLTCKQCLPTDTSCGTIDCSDQCLTSTITVSVSGTESTTNLKTCGGPGMCESESANLGLMKISSNAQCCATDLCNSQTLPAPAKQSPNGRMCYTCDGESCSNKVSCDGNQDRCISISAKQGGNTLTLKGCASKSSCTLTGSQQPGITYTSLSCCEGNLCNGSERFTLSFFLMVVPLLSSIFFY